MDQLDAVIEVAEEVEMADGSDSDSDSEGFQEVNISPQDATMLMKLEAHLQENPGSYDSHVQVGRAGGGRRGGGQEGRTTTVPASRTGMFCPGMALQLTHALVLLPPLLPPPLLPPPPCISCMTAVHHPAAALLPRGAAAGGAAGHARPVPSNRGALGGLAV